MNRFLIVITFLICVKSYGQSQILSKSTFDYANKSGGMGILGGVVGAQDNYSYGAIGLNITYHGVYADILFWPKEHESDVRIKKWHDKSSIAYHVGYQVPLFKSFRIIPVVGYAKVEEGETDGSNWSVDSNGINNKFTAEKRVGGFDYGGVFVFNSRRTNLFIALTRRTIYGGIGISIGE